MQPEKPFSEMTIEDRRNMMATHHADRYTTASPTQIQVDLRDYVRAAAAVCDALVSPDDLAKVSVSCTERGAVLMSVLVPASNAHPCEVYSSVPNLKLDILALFSNLQDWLMDSEAYRTVVPACPLAGHHDMWDLRLIDADENSTGAGELWKVCTATGRRVGRFHW